MQSRNLLNPTSFALTLKRLCFELIENHGDFKETVLIGLQPRGVFLATRLKNELSLILPSANIKQGNLDVTFFRDDIRRTDVALIPNATNIDFIIENKNVIVVDDVLFTGRTIRSGLDAMLAFGRPKKVELLVLIDRLYTRHLPIQPNYVGKEVDSITEERVKVEWKESEGEDNVWLMGSKTQKA